MSYSTSSTLFYGIKVKEFPEDLPDGFDGYCAGDCCIGDLDYFIGVETTEKGFDDCEKFYIPIKTLVGPTQEEINFLENHPDKEGESQWFLVSLTG